MSLDLVQVDAGSVEDAEGTSNLRRQIIVLGVQIGVKSNNRELENCHGSEPH